MKAKSIFSKVLSGALALGMVATMMPAMSLFAQAAPAVNVNFIDATGITPDGRNSILKEYPTSSVASALADPISLPNVGAQTIDVSSDDAKFVIVPGDYWEYPNSTAATPSILPGNNTSTTWSGWGEFVWSGEPMRNGMTVEPNTYDETGRSWILTFKSSLFNKSTANGRDVEITLPKAEPIKVTITVNGNDNVSLSQTSWLPTAERDKHFSSKTWTITYDPDEVNQKTKEKGVYKVSTGTSNSKPVSEPGIPHNVIPAEDANTFYGSEIMVAATKNPGATGRFGVNVTNTRGVVYGEADEGETNSYTKSNLVDMLNIDTPVMNNGMTVNGVDTVPNDIYSWMGLSSARNGWRWKAGEPLDMTSYIGIQIVDNRKVLNPEEIFDDYHLNTLAVSNEAMTTAAKSDLPEEIGENISLTINPEAIYRLYVFGNAEGNDGIYDNEFAYTGVGDAWLRGTSRQGNNINFANFVTSNRYGPYKNIVINFGDLALRKDGAIKIQNGDAITNNVGVANIYRYEYVIRDKNGNRFDHLNGSNRTYESLSSEPAEYPWQNVTNTEVWPGTPDYQTGELYMDDYAQGDTFEFQVRIDRYFEAGPLFDIYARGIDDASDKSNYKNEKVEVTKVNDHLYNCKFTLGPNSPYRILVDGVVPATTYTVFNVPESDAVFESTHQENVLPLTNAFYGYVPFLSQNNGGYVWDYDDDQYVRRENLSVVSGTVSSWQQLVRNNSCNVANPRYQLYVAANEEDEGLIDLVSFARPGAVATGVSYVGTSFPAGDTKFKIRFNDEFINTAADVLNIREDRWMHGTFDNDRTDDRYGKGENFKVFVNGKEVTVADDDTFTANITANTNIEVKGVEPAYYVYMANLGGFDIELLDGKEAQREEYLRGDNDTRATSADGVTFAYDFRTSVVRGDEYRFKINFDNGSEPGADFKVYLAENNTELKADANGVYTFTVRDDTEVVVGGTVTTGFADMASRSDEAQRAVQWAADNGVVNGIGNNQFAPTELAKRGDVVTVLWRMKGSPAADGNTGFADVPSGMYYAPAIKWARTNNVVTGTSATTFEPERMITRGEVVTVLHRIAGAPASSVTNRFADVPNTEFFANAVKWAIGQGVTNGTSDTTFSPYRNITREELVLFLYRAQGYLK